MIRDPAAARALKGDAGTVQATRRAHMEQAHESILAEIRGETAAALGRAGRKLQSALVALHTVAERFHALDYDDPDRLELSIEHRARRHEALRARWELEVHREAIGLLRHDDLYELYPIPEPLPRL